MKTRQNQTLFTFMNLIIALLLKNGQYRTMQHYKAARNSYMRFRGNKDITLKEIDAEEMSLFLSSAKRWDTTLRPPHRYISAPSSPPK